MTSAGSVRFDFHKKMEINVTQVTSVPFLSILSNSHANLMGLVL
jgi:hypothetical protein